MKMLLKIVFGLVAAGVVLVLAVMVAVLLFVDPNDYRDEIATQVERQTGRTLTIDGELGLSLLPCCGIRLAETSLSNPPGFDTPQFARVERVRLGLEIWPLLTERALVIGEVDLQGLDVELVRRADGRDNWSFDTAEDQAAAAEDVEDAGAQPTSLSVAGINIGNARLVYRDAIDKLEYRLEDVNLNTGLVAPGEPFDLSASFRFQDVAAGLAADTKLDGVALIDLDAQRAQLDDAKVKLELAGKSLPAEKVAANLRLASLGYELDSGNAKLGAVAGDVDVSGGRDLGADTAKLAFELGGLDYDGAAGAARLAGIDAKLSASGGALPADGLKADIEVAGVDYNLESGAGAVRDLAAVARGAGAELRLTGGGTLKTGANRLKGSFELPAGSPREWLEKLGEAAPETQDPAVLTKLSASGGWALGDDSLALDDLAVKLDDTAVTGELGVRNFAAPRVNIALAVDAIDLDRYLAPAAEEEADAGDDGAATELPREELRDLYLDGTLSVGKLLVAGLRLDDVRATARARDGVLTLEPLTAQLYGGRYEGSIRLDGSGEQTQVDLRQSLDAVQVGGLLADLAEVEQLEGLVVARLDLKGAGRTDADLRNTLAGTVSFELADGIYKGLDIWHEIRKVRATVRGEPPPARTGPAQTEITAMDFAGKLVDGKLTSDRMVAQLPFLRVTGNGALTLSDESLDYRFDARVLQIPEFPDGERLKDLEGWSIPLRLGGTLEQPKLGVDLAEFAKTRAAQEIQKKLFEKLGLEEKQDRRQPAEQAPTEQAPADSSGAPPDTQAEPAQPEPEEKKPQSPEDLLKRGLEDLFGR